MLLDLIIGLKNCCYIYIYGKQCTIQYLYTNYFNDPYRKKGVRHITEELTKRYVCIHVQ